MSAAFENSKIVRSATDEIPSVELDIRREGAVSTVSVQIGSGAEARGAETGADSSAFETLLEILEAWQDCDCGCVFDCLPYCELARLSGNAATNFVEGEDDDQEDES